MKLSYEDHGAVTVLTLSGELINDQCDALRRSCQERLASGIRDMVIDLEHVSLIDSAGLEALLWLMEELNGVQGQLRLVRPDANVRKILEVTRLEQRFNIHDTIESAAKSLRYAA